MGLKSMLPKCGRMLRMGRNAGSVARYSASPIDHTTRLRVSSTPNEARVE